MSEERNFGADLKEFVGKFNLPRNGFLQPAIFDKDFGFSVEKRREHEGEAFASLYKFYISPENLNTDESRKAIFVSVSYGKKTDEGIILSSSEWKDKRRLNWPIGLQSKDEFYYDFLSKTFFHKDREITAENILNQIEKWHNKPTKVDGWWLVARLFFFQVFLARLFRILFEIIAWFQYVFSGEKIKIFQDLREGERAFYAQTFIKKSVKTSSDSPIDIFGYKVKPSIAFGYSLFHLLTYLILEAIDFKPLWLVTIFKVEFLTIMYAIISLGLANSFFPIIFKPGDPIKTLLRFIQGEYLKNLSRNIPI